MSDDNEQQEPNFGSTLPPPLPEPGQEENRTQTLRTRMSAARDKITEQIKEYTRTNLKVNTGFFKRDFDRTNLSKWVTKTLARQVESDGVKFWSKTLGNLGKHFDFNVGYGEGALHCQDSHTRMCPR